MPEYAPRNGTADANVWLARARSAEEAHDLASAFDAYQQALSLAPASLIIVRHLARLAFRLNHWDVAEKLYAHLIAGGDHDFSVLTAYASTLREQGRYDEAIAFLKDLLGRYPGETVLWEGLGTILLSKGDRETALIFLDEALRLAPDNLQALFNRGCARLEQGNMTAGYADVSDCARLFSDPDNRTSAELTCAHAALAMGELTAGWRWYEARHMRNTAREVHFNLKSPRWISGQPLTGKRLFVSAEQGLGDEILYASLLPDIVAELGDTGHLGIGVEPRLVALFQRSFPQATVVAHHTQTRDGIIYRDFPDLGSASFEMWALMGDFLASRRPSVDAFPERRSFLTPAPDRVSYWKTYFDALNPLPKVGVLWKSLKASALRDRSFSPFMHWQSVLATPDLQFINLQYGDTTDDLKAAQAAGLNLHTPHGIDLKQDLDELAALTTALDVLVGPSNATSNIAAACGNPVWMISPPRTWLTLGQTHYPWYPSVQLFVAPTYDDWAPALNQVKQELKALKF